ncbi:restriction endonuclease subunit S [Desulfobotulus mexicanus]|uniref:Restriction endonuclease subunit S n=1 Tax=Desulfobotulus mexicanus TaxID=2586642 RepID=A0A5Q4VAA4_9BACT|nr:restriction endonuclease subunit S [Desulfobotulus mexicanus]TYT74674.1 restriction endonuclease subunit S [Desulfobotulus mexicanus]
MKTQLLLKQARVSLIPHGWQISQIGKSCSIRNDLRKPISLEERSSIKGDYPYYGPTGILDYIDQYLLDGEFALIGEDGDHFLKPEEKPQTILAKGKFNVNNHAHVIASTNVCSAEWFATFYKHRNITDFLSRQGANRYKLNKATLEKLPILLPPLPEQKAISGLLSTWDEAIEKTERLIHANERRFHWLLHKLMKPTIASNNECSVISDELKDNSDLSTHNSALGKGPHTQENLEWKKVKIGSFLNESRISGTNGHDAQKITVKLYGKGVIAKDEKRIGSKTTQYYVRKAGQLIYSKLDFLNGAFGIIPNDLDGFESTLDLPAFDISDSVSKEWLLYYLIRPEYYTRQLGLAKGQRKARRVSPSEFLNSKILLPPLHIQKRIAEFLSSSQQEIDLLKQLSKKYKTQKRGLMQKMLTGQWRVKPDIVMGYA